MVVFRRMKDKIAWLTTLASISQNISAGWFGVIIFSPGLSLFSRPDWPFILISSLVLGILFMYLSVWLLKRVK